MLIVLIVLWLADFILLVLVSSQTTRGSPRVVNMASRYERGFYKRLQGFSTADEWKALCPMIKRKSKANVYEVEYILGERKGKVSEFQYSVFHLRKFNYIL